MTSIYNNTAAQYYDHLFVDLAGGFHHITKTSIDKIISDPRTNDWFLIKSPLPGLSIIGAYLYFVLSWGPRYMKHRKPYELTNILIVYNFLQVCISCFLVFEVNFINSGKRKLTIHRRRLTDYGLDRISPSNAIQSTSRKTQIRCGKLETSTYTF